MTRTVIPIVEGHSERESVPILLRKILNALEVFDLQIHRPIRVHRHRIVKEEELKKKIQYAARTPSCESILVLIDADDDCAGDLGPQMHAWAGEARPDKPCKVVLAVTEYESWFLAGLDSLRGQYGIPTDAEPPDPPEQVRDAKGALSRMMSHRYVETIHQPKLTGALDFHLTRERSPSFDKLWRDVAALANPEGQ